MSYHRTRREPPRDSKTGEDTERIDALLRRGRVHVQTVIVESGSVSPGKVELTLAGSNLPDPLTAAFGGPVHFMALDVAETAGEPKISVRSVGEYERRQ